MSRTKRLSFHDAILLGPDFAQRFKLWRSKLEGHFDECLSDLSTVGHESYAYAFTVLLFLDLTLPAVEGTKKRERRHACSRIRCLRVIKESWGLDIVHAYNWKDENTTFCELLRWFAERKSWKEVATKLNRYIYEKQKLTSHSLRHLRNEWNNVVPIHDLADLDMKDKHDYNLDEHGLLNLSLCARDRKRMEQHQVDAFGRCPQPKSVCFDRDLPLRVVNYYAKHIAKQTPSGCFVLPADSSVSPSNAFYDMPSFSRTRTAVRLVRDKTWFMVIKTEDAVVLFDPTASSVRPATWKNSQLLQPETSSRSDASGVLLLGYLKHLRQDPSSFLSGLHHHVDVQVLRQDIENVVLYRPDLSPRQ